jgi:hypothetical protein
MKILCTPGFIAKVCLFLLVAGVLLGLAIRP